MPPRLLILAATLISTSAGLMAQPPAALPDDERDRFVQLFLETINQPTAESVAAFEVACAYDAITDESTLAARLTRDFRSISNDKHLRIRPNTAPDPLAMSPGASPAAPPAMRGDNSGFKKADVLEGNIGYVRFDFFEDSDDARQTGAAAMTFVSRCDAVIFDMRRNGGGSPEMVRFTTSYLVGH